MPHRKFPHPEERPEGARLEEPTTVLQVSLRYMFRLARAQGLVALTNQSAAASRTSVPRA